jgi:phosphotransferase system  glucose/maltose/N-acetylglucosamine-specific IIC component
MEAMTTSNNGYAASAPAPAGPLPAPTGESKPMSEGQKRGIIIGIIVGLVIVLALAVAAAIWLVSNPGVAASVRDVFIIFMGLVFLLIGAALVVLIFQLAVLTNMLQHEIKPILDSTNETVNTLRGTTAFVSENLVEPIMKLNSYVAAIAQVADSLGALGRFGRKR